MKAILAETYGPPEVLQLHEVEKPTPTEDEVLIRVHAASVNSADWRRMRAVPFLIRTSGGLLRPKDPRTGGDVAGVIEAVGGKITRFKPGDAVFGEVAIGSYAEYVCAREKNLVLKPENISFEAAAASPVAALTALQGLRDYCEIEPGMQVLINGASGGVGSFSVMIARALGAEVTGVCSTRNLEQTRRIGAQHVIDYTQQDFTQLGVQYDRIFDVAAVHSVFDLSKALKPGGKCVVTGFTTIGHLLHISMFGGMAGRRHGQTIVMMEIAKVVTEDLETIAEMLASGAINPPIDHAYSLEEAADALRRFEVEHAQGKIVISVRQET